MTCGRRTLRAQLTALFLAIAVVPSLAVGAIAALVSARSVHEGISARNLQVARAVAGEVGRFLDAQEVSLREMALATSVGGGDLAAFEREASTHLAASSDLQSVVLLDRRGRVRAAVPADPDVQDTDLSGQPFVREAFVRREPTWSSATLSLRTGLPVVVLVVPGDGILVVGYVDIGAVLSSIVARTRLGPSGHAAIIDRTGVVLAHPDARLVREQVNLRDVGLVERALASGEATAEYTFEGQRLLGSISPVPQTHWVVLATDSAEAALGPVARLWGFLAATVGVAMLAAVCAGLASARRVLRPLAELSEETRRLEAGGSVAPPAGRRRAGPTEIDALAERFEAMAAAIRTREADLRTSEERFRLAFATSPDVMTLVRMADGVYVEVNGAFTRFTGWAAEEVLGRTVAARGLWADRTRRAAFREMLVHGEPLHNVETEFRRKGGSVVTGLLSAGTVTIGGTPHVLAIVRDITERKRSELEREVLREQLLHAQKMEAIGRLAGGVAHDFNNVLTSILASAQLLTESIAPEDPRRADVQQIGSDARRAAELTRQLLSFARKESVAPQVIRIEDRARSLEKMLRRVMGANISVEASFSSEGWPVFVDAGQVEQVIVNLAVNARDAMPSGGRLTISTENVAVQAMPARPGDPPPGEYVLVTVADTGIGMTPEVRAHAFEPFFTTKGSQGTGLGLATCFSIVTQAGGSLALDSAPGAGTRFRIYLPRAVARAGTVEEPEALDLFGSESVLVVEDDAIVRRLAVRSLRQLGYRVTDAGSATEARAQASRHAGPIDGVVMDVELPDATGREAASRILEGREGVPVLFVSGSREAAAADRRPGDPPAQFLPKPYTPIDLARRLRLLLDGAQRRATSAADRGMGGRA